MGPEAGVSPKISNEYYLQPLRQNGRPDTRRLPSNQTRKRMEPRIQGAEPGHYQEIFAQRLSPFRLPPIYRSGRAKQRGVA